MLFVLKIKFRITADIKGIYDNKTMPNIGTYS